MDELIDKEYARKCDCTEPEGRSWYVPHQGMLNTNKGKLELYFTAILSIKVTR